jgi:hypothetical protein
MRANLGYQTSELCVPLGDPLGARAMFADVRGESYGVTWRRLGWVAALAFGAAVVARALVSVRKGEAPIVPNALLAVAIAAYLVARLGRMRTRKYAWVKCSERKRPVSGRDIHALSAIVNEARASESLKWRPSRILFVAGGNGFEDDALSLARSVGIECYRRTESGFERAT